MRATVNEETCAGCGMCADACPAVFDMNNENIAEVKVERVPPEAEAACRDAAEDCPVEAIGLTD